MKKLEVSGGMSTKDSVAFFLKGNKKGVKVTRLENGTIETEEIELNVQMKSIFALLKFILGGFIFRVIFYSCLGLENWMYHIPTIAYGFLFGMAILAISENKEFRMYHGAEHKVANWCTHNNLSIYNTYNLTVENVRNSVRIHKGCGTNLLATYFTFYLVSSICLSYFNVHIPEIITAMAPLFLYGVFPFNIIGLAAQFITTAEPKKEHLEVAIAALKKNVYIERQKEELKEAQKAMALKVFQDMFKI